MADENQKYAKIETLLLRLRQSYRSLTRRRLLSGLSLFVAVTAGLLSLLMVIEQQHYLSPGWKLFSWIVLLFTGALSAWLILRRQPRPGFKTFYHQFCQKHELEDLENALDLYLDESASESRMQRLAISTSLDRTDPDRVHEHLRTFSTHHSSQRIFRWTTALMVIVLAGTSLLILQSAESLERVTRFWEIYEKPNPWQFTVAPGDTTLEYGSSFQPHIEFTGDARLPSEVLLAIRTDSEESFRFRPMESPQRGSGSRTYLSAPAELTGDATWYVIMDGYESDRYHVDIQLRPRFEELTVQITPPGYTGLESTVRTYPFARLEAYGGSVLTIDGRLNKPVEEISLNRAGGDDLDLEQDSDDPLRYTSRFTLDGSDTLRFTMADRDGLTNANPFRVIMSLLRDQEPVVTILEPDGDLMVSDPERLDIFYQASDDFGLTDASLHWELLRAFTADPQPGTMAVDPPDSGETVQVIWDLLELDLRPRDQLTFWISVQDNDEFNGYKTATSDRIILEVPSLSAWLDDVGEREQSVQSSLEEVAENHRKIEQEYSRLRERLASQQEAGWGEQQILDDMERQKQEMDEAVDRLNQEFEEIRKEIESSDQISEETRRSYQELREVMQELDDPELQQAIEQLRQSLESMSAYEMQQALENFEFNEQTYRDRLNRTVELFKTLKMNSDLDRLAARYDDMAERVTEDESEEGASQTGDRQRQVREDTESVETQLEELDNRPPRHAEERLKRLKEESIAELHELQRQLDELIAGAASGASEDGSDPADEGSGADVSEPEEGSGADTSEPEEGSAEGSSGSETGGEDSGGGAGDSDSESVAGREESGHSGEDGSDEGAAGETGSEAGGSEERASGETGSDEKALEEQISQQFQARAEQIRQARQQMSGQQVQINLMALQHSLYTLIELSEVQEGLARQTAETESGNSGYIDLARRQQNVVSQFSQVADTLFQVSQEIPSLSEAINVKRSQVERSLTSAVRQMTEREQRGATLTSRESLGGINELASMLAESIDQLMDQQSGGTGGGGMSMEQMLEQMQNMSGDQQMMNDQLQQLINDAQGERLNREQSERLEQMARSQNEIRRHLEQLQRSGSFQQGDRMLSELQRMTEEMEEAINDMRGGMADPLMAERQQNILSRMLQAEEAMQQQGESEEYEGRQPEDFNTPLPPQLTLDEVEEEMRSRLQDPAYSPFRESYQQLIERYFEWIRQADTDGR